MKEYAREYRLTLPLPSLKRGERETVRIYSGTWIPEDEFPKDLAFGPSTTYTGESTHPTYYSRDEANFNEGIF
jgi:hypothetical protein